MREENLSLNDMYKFNYKYTSRGFDPLILIKTYISNLVRTTRSWNNHHQLRSKANDGKAKYL